MLNLFYKKTDIRYGTINYGKLEYLRYNINSALYILKSYYSSSKRYVRRPNMLVSLLGNLDIDITLPPEEVYSKISSDSVYLASNFNIINGVKTEVDFNSDTVIYNSKELFMYANDNFNFLNKNCLEEASVKCISSNVSDFFLTHPKEFKDSVYDTDIYLYTINIDMLGMQYYYWCKEQLEIELDTDPARFVYEVVLVNVIESVFLANIVNRIINLSEDIYVKPFVNYNPFPIKDLYKKIDAMYLWYLKQLKKKRDLHYVEILTTIPLLTTGTLYDYLTMDELYFSRRTKWFYILAKLDIVNFLLSNFFSKKEKDYHNDIMIDFSYMERNKYLVTNSIVINSILEKKENELKQNLFLRS